MGHALLGRAHAALALRLGGERGQGTVEYVGLILLMAVVLAGVVGAAGKTDAGGIALRYGSFYGAPNDGLIEPVRKRQFPIVGDGGGVMSFIHLDDAAAATVLALEHDRAGIHDIGRCDTPAGATASWPPTRGRSAMFRTAPTASVRRATGSPISTSGPAASIVRLLCRCRMSVVVSRFCASTCAVYRCPMM